MAWSTRELAGLAGTTVNAIRHYHRSGLLEEPRRLRNGYKQYGVDHLVRLLQIRRLRDLGVPVAEIERLESGADGWRQALEALDAELVETINRSLLVRGEIARMLEHRSAGAVAPGFTDIAARLSPTQRSLTLIYAHLYQPEVMADIREMFEAEVDPATAAFESLPPDADEATRERVVGPYARTIAEARARYPWIDARESRYLRHSPEVTAAAMAEAMRVVYNAAQQDVLRRAAALSLTPAVRDAAATSAG